MMFLVEEGKSVEFNIYFFFTPEGGLIDGRFREALCEWVLKDGQNRGGLFPTARSSTRTVCYLLIQC